MSSIQSDEKQNAEPLLMIPGPIEFDDRVYAALARKTQSHVAPSFIDEFGFALKRFQVIIKANDECESFILSGGGSLGWDAICCSLCEPELNERALILNGGYFSDNFRECAKAYGLAIDEISASKVGDVVTPAQLEQYLSSADKIASPPKLICITQVDTSCASLTDVAKLAAVCTKLSPSSFIAVDGVCSFGAEDFRFSEWNIDVCMTASQKAFGTPPGLCMMAVSKRVLNYMENERKHPIRSWYANLLRWLPIMRAYKARKPSYFSTPNVNLIVALNESQRLILDEGIDNVIRRHAAFAKVFRNSLRAIGLEFVAVDDGICANTITAVKYPKGVNGADLLTCIKQEKRVIFAGGLHKEIKSTYFRVGHMGISVKIGSKDLLRCVEAIEYGLEKCGYEFEKGLAIKTFTEQAKSAKLL
eukprot:CAMPEP_0202691384 /NCGR_PEP_ID=MMETSP1385-20130828/6113_1 /ASSEMBLY_ACC=CAM_ASM_000861 /TAXON_ID=933848 /ORGANISM="Elphidium margaritaceum" /LENGTH=417 /DNA_ID=CAMNT_0049346785 /DNA_START=124 /DNA_END=1377 /DNA_ORIENTATION=+